MNIIEKVRQDFDSMTKSERQVASYFFSHLNDFAFFTLDHIASDIDISTTSVIRFCRRLGFSGYKNFQNALRSEMKYQSPLPAKLQLTLEESVDNGLLAQTIQQGIRCIQKTFSEISPELLTDTVNSLLSAKRVFVYGMKESYAVTHYAWTRFMTVRDNAYILDAYNGCVEAIHSLTAEDICVVFLFHRYTKETLRILELLKSRNIPVLLITSPPYDSLVSYAKKIIPCYVDAHGIKNTSLAPVCLMDYLCNALVLSSGDSGMLRMQEMERWFQLNESLDR